MGRPIKCKPDEAAQAVLAAYGNMTAAARRLGITRETLYQIRKRSNKIIQAQHDGEEALKDVAEAKLVQLINEGNLGAICFYLKCKAKDRGYIERHDLFIDGKVTLEASYDSAWYGESNDSRTDAAPDPSPVAPLPLQDSGNGSQVGKNGNGTHRGG